MYRRLCTQKCHNYFNRAVCVEKTRRILINYANSLLFCMSQITWHFYVGTAADLVNFCVIVLICCDCLSSPSVVLNCDQIVRQYYRQDSSRDMTKPTKWMCAQLKLRSAWASAQSDQSLLSAWRKLGSLATHWAHSKDSDQTGQIWVGNQLLGYVVIWINDTE